MKHLSILLIISCLFLVQYSSYSQVHNISFSYVTPQMPTVDAGNDTTALFSHPLILNGQVTGGTPPYTYLWQPGTDLDDSTILNPTVNFTVWFPSNPQTLTLTVTDSNGCVASDQIIIHVLVNSIEKHSLSDLRLFPNPASGVVWVEGLSSPDVEVTCYTLMGQRVASRRYSNVGSPHEIDLGSLSPGIYFLKISAEASHSLHKLVIQ